MRMSASSVNTVSVVPRRYVFKGGSQTLELTPPGSLQVASDGSSAVLKARYHPRGSGWMALGLTVVSMVLACAAAQGLGFAVGPVRPRQGGREAQPLCREGRRRTYQGMDRRVRGPRGVAGAPGSPRALRRWTSPSTFVGLHQRHRSTEDGAAHHREVARDHGWKGRPRHRDHHRCVVCGLARRAHRPRPTGQAGVRGHSGHAGGCRWNP